MWESVRGQKGKGHEMVQRSHLGKTQPVPDLSFVSINFLIGCGLSDRHHSDLSPIFTLAYSQYHRGFHPDATYTTEVLMLSEQPLGTVRTRCGNGQGQHVRKLSAQLPSSPPLWGWGIRTDGREGRPQPEPGTLCSSSDVLAEIKDPHIHTTPPTIPVSLGLL